MRNITIQHFAKRFVAYHFLNKENIFDAIFKKNHKKSAAF